MKAGPVNAECWRLVEELCHAAQVQAEAERGAFLDQACGDDEAVVTEKSIWSPIDTFRP